jgi:uncharacterized protein YggE
MWVHFWAKSDAQVQKSGATFRPQAIPLARLLRSRPPQVRRIRLPFLVAIAGKEPNIMIRSTIAALGLFALAGTLFATPVLADDAKPPRLIQLTGHGEVKMKPDLAVVTVGVLTEAPSARDAVSANNDAMTNVLTRLKNEGIADKDLQTSNFSVSPRYDYQNNAAPRLIGYDVSNTVSVTVRNLDKLGGVLDGVVSEGSNQVNGVMFSLADPEPAADEARKLAVEDALRKAKIYAEAAGVTLGEIASMGEGIANPPPVPIYRKAMAEAAAAVPIAQGEQTVGIDVNIAWEIK